MSKFLFTDSSPFSHYPDFSELGYQVLGTLGCNREAGRITYLADALNSNQKVVIKEFCFASVASDLSGSKAYDQEIEILQQLNHPRIPHYVASFEISGDFYLVQEFKNAPSLGLKRSFHPEEIKQIALSILEILVYLQTQVPPIIHRDIKPENILVDEQLNAYLVDFGLARLRGAKMSLSSFVTGTPGFMPPEEQFGYALTEASDLYSLGATLICLLTNTRAVDIGQLIDDNYRFNLQKLVSQVSPGFALWLRKMVECNRKHRYKNASVALTALKPIQVIGVASGKDSFIAAIQGKNRLILLGLATFSLLSVVSAILMIFQPGDAGKRLLKNKECLDFELRENCLKETGY